MIRSLQYVALTCPDMAEGKKFYDAMGLEGRAEGEQLVYRCAGRAQDQLRLVPGEKKGIAWITWGTRAGEIDTLANNLDKAGVPMATAPGGVENNGLWFRDPDGVLVNIIVAEPQPQTRAAVEINNPGTEYLRKAAAARESRHRYASAQARTSPEVHNRYQPRCEILHRSTRYEIVRPDWRRTCGLPALRRRQRSPHAGHGDVGSAGSASHVLGNGQCRPVADVRRAAAEGRLQGRLGHGPSYLRLELLPLYPRPLDGSARVLLGYRLHPEDATWEVEKAEANEESLFQWATTPPPEDFLKNYEVAAA